MTSVSRTASNRWFKLVWIVPAIVVGLALLVLAARGIRASVPGQSFLAGYPGESRLPSFAPVGFPTWVGWQHGLNVFFLVFMVRSGWMVRTVQRPGMYWTRNNRGRIRTKGAPTRISINLWLHLSFDVLWVLNGIVFWVLVFCTGQWTRIVPTSWGVFPNAVSALLQYASLQWPTENGWSNYNSLQVLSYFLVVFIAAPVALFSGLRMSPAWPKNAPRLSKAFPLAWARATHYPTMIFFVAFVIVHVTLVFATGALNNLNHMYASRNDDSWVGFAFFAGSLVVIVAAWMAARPIVLRSLASLTGSVTR